jgi:hypothetical protein
LWLANGEALAGSNDPPTVKKTAKARKSATKPEKEKPDKNQYWILNPTSPDEMRSFNTDRPTKAKIPYTVGAGHFQYETNLVNIPTSSRVGAYRYIVGAESHLQSRFD